MDILMRMSNKTVYDIIKKQNGERFAQLIRKFDSSLFEIEGLPVVLKYAGRDVEPLLDFLCMLKNVQIKEVENPQNPFDLLQQAGYRAEIADTHQKQNIILKYFEKGEELCTFDDYNRYQSYFIINCVKEGAERLKRTDFKRPEREDEYGVSVISIQILKRGGFIKITNRYNHTVPFPDNTFNSNPDNIIDGLSAALKNYLKVDFSATQVPLPEGYVYLNGQIIEYDYERDNIFFSNNYFVKDGKIISTNKDYQFIVDRFVLDLKEKCIQNPLDEKDSFVQVMTAELQNKKHLKVVKFQDDKWDLYGDNELLMHVECNQIKSLYLPTTKGIGSCFISYYSTLEEIHAPQVRYLGRNSLNKAPLLKTFLFENLELMGERCISSTMLNVLFMPKIKKINDQCFTLSYTARRPGKMTCLSFPLLREIGWGCFSGYQIDEIYLPSCKKIEGSFGCSYAEFKKAYLPELIAFPKNSHLNSGVKNLFVPKIIPVRTGFLSKMFLPTRLYGNERTID